jgi:peptidoglycan/xylan/chitin deacetylase (PgdA/CDA1 family)
VARLVAALALLLVGGEPCAGAHASGHEEARTEQRVPILMYHVLADPDGSAPNHELYVSPDDFRAQVRWLHARGYRAITLRTLQRHWDEGTPLPRRAVVLSFDDGFRSHVRVALPALREHGWSGVLNLAVSHLEPHGDLRSAAVRRMLRAGWELGSHTLTHPDLTKLGDQQLEREVRGSRTALRDRFAVDVDVFCYPSGRYDARVVAAVRDAGYLGATTTRHGLARRYERFTLARVRVDRRDGVGGLARKLAALDG